MLPLFFFMLKKKKERERKTIKTCLQGKETISNPSMWGKIKPVLRERGSELPRKKSSHPTCFFYHPHKIPAEIFSRQQKKILGIKELWFLEYKAKEIC
jgi:hypothetical protein